MLPKVGWKLELLRLFQTYISTDLFESVKSESLGVESRQSVLKKAVQVKILNFLNKDPNTGYVKLAETSRSRWQSRFTNLLLNKLTNWGKERDCRCANNYMNSFICFLYPWSLGNRALLHLQMLLIISRVCLHHWMASCYVLRCSPFSRMDASIWTVCWREQLNSL